MADITILNTKGNHYRISLPFYITEVFFIGVNSRYTICDNCLTRDRKYFLKHRWQKLQPQKTVQTVYARRETRNYGGKKRIFLQTVQTIEKCAQHFSVRFCFTVKSVFCMYAIRLQRDTQT